MSVYHGTIYPHVIVSLFRRVPWPHSIALLSFGPSFAFRAMNLFVLNFLLRKTLLVILLVREELTFAGPDRSMG